MAEPLKDLDQSTWVRIRFSVDISADKLGDTLKDLSLHAKALGIKLTVDNIHYENPLSDKKIIGDW
jgi:hypothetical protein